MHRITAITLLCLSPFATRAQDVPPDPKNQDATPEFVFEGDVDHVDPLLRDAIGPPRVLSGTMQLASVWEHYDDGGFRNYQIIKGAEFTLDRNYVLSYEGWIREDSTVKVSITDGEAREKDDLISFNIPATGETLQSNFVALSLSILLSDEDGVMIESDGPFYTAPAYKEATFELVFINPETGDTAKATGEITLFANLERDVTPQEDYQQLEEQIRELDEKLTNQEKLISNLRAKLNLKDFDLAQRDNQIAELEAKNAALAKEAEQLRTGEAVQLMEKTNAKLLDKLEESQEAREFSAASVAQMTVRQEFLAKDNAELAKNNTVLRDELANALSELGEMRNKQELLARQANVSFQQTLPPLPKSEAQAALPLATSKPVASKPPVVKTTKPVVGRSLMEIAANAMQTEPAQPETTPPGQLEDDTQPSGIATGQEADADWKFMLPTVAKAQPGTPAPQTSTAAPRGIAVRDAPEEESDNNRMVRRGPRR